MGAQSPNDIRDHRIAASAQRDLDEAVVRFANGRGDRRSVDILTGRVAQALSQQAVLRASLLRAPAACDLRTADGIHEALSTCLARAEFPTTAEAPSC